MWLSGPVTDHSGPPRRHSVAMSSPAVAPPHCERRIFKRAEGSIPRVIIPAYLCQVGLLPSAGSHTIHAETAYRHANEVMRVLRWRKNIWREGLRRN